MGGGVASIIASVAAPFPVLAGAFTSGVGDESCLLAADDRIVVVLLTFVGDSGMLCVRKEQRGNAAALFICVKVKGGYAL